MKMVDPHTVPSAQPLSVMKEQENTRENEEKGREKEEMKRLEENRKERRETGSEKKEKRGKRREKRKKRERVLPLGFITWGTQRPLLGPALISLRSPNMATPRIKRLPSQNATSGECRGRELTSTVASKGLSKRRRVEEVSEATQTLGDHSNKKECTAMPEDSARQG